LKEPQGHRIARYELLSKVGEGANGIVYRAQDPTIRRVVALKVIPAEPIEQADVQSSSRASAFFEREAQAAGALLHPNIVTLYDAGRDGDWYYLAMEFIEGGTFSGEIACPGGATIERAVEVTAVVAEALDFAHERGVVHRDIKPANLMILPDKTVKVADFGIARLTSSTQTMTSDMMVGTPHYMSPEQVRGGKVDGRSDIFSLGVVLYESLTGKKPFQADSLAAILNRIMNGSVVPPHEASSRVPVGLSQMVLRAIARDPESRYARGRDFAADLRRFLGKSRGGPPAARAPRRRLSRAQAAVIGILGAAVIGTGAYVFRSQVVPPAPKKGYIHVALPGAEVYVDGKLVGPTPATIETVEGSHEIEIRKEGYYPWSLTLDVAADQQTPVEPSLIAQGR
jgi:serine/threonine-protein kinase